MFVDFSKAFENLYHKLIITNLERYSFRGVTSELLKSDLSHRKQYVTVNGRDSGGQPLTGGVP